MPFEELTLHDLAMTPQQILAICVTIGLWIVLIGVYRSSKYAGKQAIRLARHLRKPRSPRNAPPLSELTQTILGIVSSDASLWHRVDDNTLSCRKAVGVGTDRKYVDIAVVDPACTSDWTRVITSDRVALTPSLSSDERWLIATRIELLFQRFREGQRRLALGLPQIPHDPWNSFTMAVATWYWPKLETNGDALGDAFVAAGWRVCQGMDYISVRRKDGTVVASYGQPQPEELGGFAKAEASLNMTLGIPPVNVFGRDPLSSSQRSTAFSSEASSRK